MTISKSNIQKMASTVKIKIESTKKLPATITIDGTIYTYGQIAYILAYAINNPNKSADVFAVGKAPKPTGQSINKNLAKSDYKDLAKRIAKFIKEKKRCPNYITSKQEKKKLSPKLFIYMLARIVVWYNTKGSLPAYVNANSGYFTQVTTTTTTKTTTAKASTSSGLKAYMTSTGCAGMGQCTGYYCACNSLQQSFYRLTGIKVAEKTIAGWAGTTSSGTSHQGIETAVAKFNKKYNKNIKITWKNFSDLGSSDSARWKALQSYIKKGAVFCHILYRDQWGHYEVPKNIGDSVKVLNSLGNSCGGATYCGYIETRSKSTQLRYMKGISQKSIAILTKG